MVGDINILVNTEETGFAHSAYQAHGTSVCDIACVLTMLSTPLRVQGELGAEMVKTAAIAGELSIPAIKGEGVELSISLTMKVSWQRFGMLILRQ